MFSNTQKLILHHLSFGHLLSGTQLAEYLDISRTAVWKNINQIKEKGIPIEVIDKQGYQIKNGLDLYDESRLKEYFSDLGIQLKLFDVIDSTLDCVDINQNQWQLVLTEQQLAGRGRRGRSWRSPYGKHIYSSLSFFHAGSLEQLQGLSLVVGLAVRDVLAVLGLADVMVKWPNDVWCQGKKIAGVLIEVKGEINEGYQVIIGLGINVQRDPSLQDFHAIAINDSIQISKNEVIQKVIPKVMQSIQSLFENRFSYFQDTFNAHHIYHNQVVSVLDEPEFQDVRVIGVEPDGGLSVEKNNKITKLYGSEISLRAKS